MIIDIIFLVVIVLAHVKGYSRGFIVAAFSVIALIVGLAAAMKLSVVTAAKLKDAVNVAAKWLPLLAFVITFIAAVLLVRLVAAALQKAVELVWLGWINRLLGMLLFLVLYTIVLSVLLFYLEKMHVISAAQLDASITYPFIKPWGPAVVNTLGNVLPFFKDMFHQLEDFFTALARKIDTSS